MCLGFVLSSVLVGDTYRSVFGNFRGEVVDASFFFKEIDFWEERIDVEKDGKVIFLVYEG